MVILAAARDAQEGRVRVARLHLEAEDVAVEAHAAVDVGDPEHEVLEPLEADAGHGATSNGDAPGSRALIARPPPGMRPVPGRSSRDLHRGCARFPGAHRATSTGDAPGSRPLIPRPPPGRRPVPGPPPPAPHPGWPPSPGPPAPPPP